MERKTWYAMKAAGDGLDIDLFDEIGLWGVSAADFRRDLQNGDNGGPITININSPGGAVFDGIAIYSMLAERRDRVFVNVYGLAASIASVVALGGKELVMHEGSFFMVHDPWTLTLGTAEEHRKTAEILDKIGQQIVDIYRQRTALTDEELEAAMRDETWFTAKEAVDAGFAVRVEGEKVAASTMKFAMLNKFKNRPVGLEIKNQAAEPEQHQEAVMENNMTPESKDVQAATPEAPKEEATVQPEMNSELRDTVKSLAEEVRSMKDKFANISLGTKVMPRDPKDAYKWMYDALMTVGTKRGIPQDEAATISVGDGFGIPIPASETFLINLNHYSIARRFGAVIRPAPAQQTKFTTGVTKNEAAIIEEHGSYAEKAEPTPVTLDLVKLGGRYSLSEETDEDTLLQVFETFQMEAAVAIAKGENHFFLDGTNSGEPSGVTQESADVTAASASAITFDELVELDESLSSEWDNEMMWDGNSFDNYRGPVYIMHPTTAAAVRTVITGESNFVFTEDGMGRLVKLFGRPVVRDSHMPEIGTGEKVIALVNWGAYIIGERRPNLAIRVGQDNDNHDITWDYNERVDGQVWDGNGAAILEMG